MSRCILSATELVRRYGGIAAVDGVNLSVQEGEFRAIIGSNGAGKTTLFNLLTGSVSPTSGCIRLGDRDITGLPPHRIARLGVGRTFQVNNLFNEATVRENIRIAVLARARAIWNVVRLASSLLIERTVEIAELVGLSGEMESKVNTLSYGDRRRLELGITLAGEPQILLLDEPTCGMSATERPAIVRLIQDIVREKKITPILIEHDMDVVFSVAQRITVMHRGRVIADGPPTEIAKNDEVRTVYLGAEVHA